MVWKKEREHTPGQLDFHLPSEREASPKHDEAWLKSRAERIAKKHRSA